MNASNIEATILGRIRDDTTAVPTTFGEIAERIRRGDFKEKVEHVRTSPSKEAAKAAKEQLPIFVPARAAGRGDAGLSQRPEFIQADIDHLDPHGAVAMVQRFREDPCVALAFRSPYAGAKAFLRIDPAKPFAESWSAMAKYVKDRYSVGVDPDADGASRVCYYSWDPDCYLAPGEVQCLAYPEPCDVPAPAPVATIPERKLTKEQLAELLQHIEPMRQGDHDHRTDIVGILATQLGDDDVIDVVESWYADHGVDLEPGKVAEDLTRTKTELGVGTLIMRAKSAGSELAKQLAKDYRQEMARAMSQAEGAALWQKINARRVGVGPKPAKPVPRVLCAGVPISTPGNLTCIQSQVKSGKTAVVGAISAACIVAEGGVMFGGHDCLGFSASPPGGKTVLHFDSEQSAFDSYAALERALRRVGIDACPAWIKSYSLAGFTPKELTAALRLVVEKEATGPGVHLILIDGFGDYVPDVNDSEASNALVAELHSMAIQFDCAIVGVLHENPGAAGMKSRGHLGSQLARKAETNLVLEKDGPITEVYADKTRGAPIPKDTGPRFRWDDVVGRHMLTTAKPAKAQAALNELRELAQEVLTAGGMRQGELRAALMERNGWASSGTTDNKIGAMKRAGVIIKDTATGRYSLAT